MVSKIIKKAFILCLFLSNSHQIFSQKYSYLLSKIDSLSKTALLENGYLAFSIKNCATSGNLLSYNAQKTMKPGSTMKLPTTATALAILGENYRYNTDIQYCGQILGDSLAGYLIIKGSGDPSLGVKRYETIPTYEQLPKKWAEMIKAKGINKISGGIIADQSCFAANSIPDSWQWGDMGNYYGAGSYGINFNENMFTAFFSTGKKSGEKSTILNIYPQPYPYNIDNQVLALAETKGDEVLFFSAPGENKILAQGSLPVARNAFSVKGALPNPAEVLINMLQSELSKTGVNCYHTSQNIDGQATSLFSERSPSLFEICLQTNFESINLNAECLMKTIGLKASGQGSDESGLSAIRNYWLDRGVNLKGFDNKDGSGMSPNNYLTSQNMVDILEAASKQPSFTAFYQSIPVVGEDGTVKNLAANTKAAGKVRAKSGTLSKVKAFAGYFYNKQNELCSFSVMANQFEGGGSQMSRELGKLIEMMVDEQ